MNLIASVVLTLGIFITVDVIPWVVALAASIGTHL